MSVLKFMPGHLSAQSHGRHVSLQEVGQQLGIFIHDNRTAQRLLCIRCSDPGAALQSAEAEAEALCCCLLSRAPSLKEMSAALSQRHGNGATGDGSMQVEQLAAQWPALLQAATCLHSAAAESQDLSNLLQVPGPQIATWLSDHCLSLQSL